MVTRKDGTRVTVDNLTDEDVALSPWNILDSLGTEEDIALYIEAALVDIEEGECDASFLFDALADAAKARAINQLAKETSIDRKMLCRMLDEDGNAEAISISPDAIAKVARTFAAPVTV
jgi:probable addiction module antidote protein